MLSLMEASTIHQIVMECLKTFAFEMSDQQADVSFDRYCRFELESTVFLYCERFQLYFCKDYG